ncbi:MAG: PH domain-containing protein, partial [Rhodobacterales bacterium]|nr:PH domain-containing protein [Rhodobacterales bacterium]
MPVEHRELKPKMTPFLWPRLAGAFVVTGAVSLMFVIGVLAVDVKVLLAARPVLWVVILVPSLYGAYVAFKKERYEIHTDHLVCHRGGLLSDGRTELDVRNITHVRLRLPFLRHRLFGIGDVRVESAGSAASEITFESIIGPEVVFEEVVEKMRANGYALEQGKVLHEESPGVVGALTDVVQVGIGGGVSLLFLLSFGVGLLADISVNGGSALGAVLMVLGLFVSVIGPVSVLAGLVIRYLDMTRRTYVVYDDAVAYKEGFLTVDNALIPYENIADASTNRTIFDQMLGLYDVKVSCQGSGSEILFRRLSRGEALQSAISDLVAKAGAKAREVTEQQASTEEDATADGEPASSSNVIAARKLVNPDEAWTAELKMNPGRAVAPLLVTLPFFPVWLIATVGMYIKASRTVFTIGPNTMANSYNFLGSTHQEFAYDKVTGVQVSRSPIDGLFKTLTVQIWSIGAPQPLRIAHVAEDSINLPALLRQCGIDASNPAEGALKQSFGPKVWAIQNVPAFVTLTFILLGLLFAAVFTSPLILIVAPFLLLLPLPMAVVTRLRVNRQKLTFHKEHLEAQTGIFYRDHVYVRYNDVKKVSTSRIPFTDQGTLTVYVAGERIQKNEKGQDTGMKIPYSLTGAYIEGISLK